MDFTDILLNDTNYKDQILKYVQHNYLVNPTYKTNKNESDNTFESKIYRSNEEKEDIYISTGKGSTKKKAEQDASKNALIYYHVISE